MMLTNRTKQTQGFTLIEMLVAMSISLILLLGVSQIFSSNKRSQRVTEGLARVQENARFAMKKIGIDMRRAGYVGCSGDVQNLLCDTCPEYDESLFDPTKGTAGWEYTKSLATSATEPGQIYTLLSTLQPGGTEGAAAKWKNDNAEGLPATLVDKVIPGSDVVVMKWMDDSDNGIELDGAVNPKSAQMGTKAAHGFSKGTVIVVSDCSGGDVFQTVSDESSSSLQRSGAQASPGNKNPGATNWSHAYPNGATISTFTSRAYYIGEGASGEPSLYSITYTNGATGQVTEEIAEGIENMQVLYGVDTNADKFAEKYVTAAQVTDHSNVVNLKIGLIARSPSDAKTTSSTRSISLLGTTINITPADQKLRFAFTTTVKLRNKGAK